MNKSDLTPARLRELLQYNPETGVFVWRVKPNRRIVKGSAAGSSRKDKYLIIRVDGCAFLGHRLAWLYVHGVLPTLWIDHINGDPGDNRLANLREVDQAVNMHNVRHANSDSLSGLRGAAWDARKKKWAAQICWRGVRHFLGYHASASQAHAAYLAAKQALIPRLAADYL